MRKVGAMAATRVFSMKAFAVANDMPLGKAQHYIGVQHGDKMLFDLDAKATS